MQDHSGKTILSAIQIIFFIFFVCIEYDLYNVYCFVRSTENQLKYEYKNCSVH